MSILDTVVGVGTSIFNSPLTQQGLDAALGAVGGQYAPIIIAAAHGIPSAISLVMRLSKGETITAAEVAAEWPAIQAEAKRVGLDWDASYAEFKQRHGIV